MGSILVRTPGTALHRQLYVILRDQILRGLYWPGEAIPNEDALCDEFGVSKITVRRAVSDLENSGYLVKRHGRGTFVTDNHPPARPFATLGLIDALKKLTIDAQVKVVEVRVADPPADIARQLDLLVGVRAVNAVRVWHRKGSPVMTTEDWVPEGIGRITKRQLQKHPLFELLMSAGVRFGRVAQEISAVAASAPYVSLLKTELAAPLLKVTRLVYDMKRRPVQHVTVHALPEQCRLLMDVSIETVNTLTTGSLFLDVGSDIAE